MEKSIEQIEEKATEIKSKIIDQEIWINFGWIALKIILILVVAFIVIRIGRSAIGNILKVRRKSSLRVSERREATLVKLLQNILTYVVFFITATTILSTLTIDVTGLIAGAGILGLAIGFGAQNLVKDIISGFFIIFEDQFSVGDEVRIGSFEGKVQEIGLRTTKILNWTGELYIVPNGSITNVTNFSIYNSMAIVDFNINYQGDLDKVESMIESLLESLPEKYDEMVGPPKLLGIQQFDSSEVVMRITAETEPLKHWYIARMIRRELRLQLDEHQSLQSENI